MDLGLDPLLPWPWLLAGAILATSLCVWFYRRWRHFVSKGYWRSLLAVKLLSIIVLFVLLLNPYHRRQKPDERKYSVVFLIDATASMDTKDCEGQTRLQVIKDRFLAADSDFQRNLLQSIRNHRIYIFAGDRQYRIKDPAAFSSLPGDTDIDLILKRTQELGKGPLRLGAVVLLTDGRDNRGVSLVDAAGTYRDAGIPVHCIGVGDRRTQADLSVAWTDVPRQAVKGKALELKGEVRRLGRVSGPVRVRLFEGDRQLAEQSVRFADGQTVQPVVFPVTSFLAGFKTYRLRAEPLPDEQNILNNVDYLGLQVRNPDEFKVLYFAGALDWNFKFMRLLAEAQERLHLSALIRTGKASWFQLGFPEGEAPTTLPAPRELNQYDCLIADLSGLQLLSDAQATAVQNFVASRGGGLIVTGVSDRIPERFANLLPVRRLEFDTLQLARSPLDIRSTGVLAAPQSELAAEVLDRLYLPGDASFLDVKAEQLKPAAKPVVTVRDGGYVLLANHAYGGGKVAMANLPATWRWVMDSASGDELYANYWGRLISWISSSSRERLTLKPHGAKLPLNAQTEVVLDLLTNDFRPANNAELTATVSGPAGEESLPLFNSARVDGRYTASFVPRMPGEYRIHVKAVLGPEDVLDGQANYLVVGRTAEQQPGPIAEPELQSLARLTGGRYWHYPEAETIMELPLADELQFVQIRRDLRRHWLFLLVILAFVMPDWILRRRIGLR